MRDARIKRSDITLVAGAIFATLSSPLILCVLLAIDLQVFAITLIQSAEVDPSGTDHFKHSVHTVTQSSQVKSVTSSTLIKKREGVGGEQINYVQLYIPAPVDCTIL